MFNNNNYNLKRKREENEINRNNEFYKINENQQNLMFKKLKFNNDQNQFNFKNNSKSDIDVQFENYNKQKIKEYNEKIKLEENELSSSPTIQNQAKTQLMNNYVNTNDDLKELFYTRLGRFFTTQINISEVNENEKSNEYINQQSNNNKIYKFL